MKKILWLDDLRQPPVFLWEKFDVIFWIKSYDVFCWHVEENTLPDFVSFDHDLSDFRYDDNCLIEKTGYDAAKFLVEYCIEKKLKLPEYNCHSMNPVGKDNILKLLKSYDRIASV